MLFVPVILTSCSDSGSGSSIINSNSYDDNVTYPKVEDNLELYPVYSRLSSDEQLAYKKICIAIDDFKKSTSVVYKASTRESAERFADDIGSLYREIIFEQSEVFWVDPYYFEYLINESWDGYTVAIQPKYIIEQENLDYMKGRLDQIIEDIIAGANELETEFDRIRYVHDAIVGNCYYDETIIDNDNYSTTLINAYGCLVEGKTICSGYTLAFDAILKRMGYVCGSEFNDYSDFSILTGHVWNYCEIEDEYYYFDLTWDDTGFDSEFYKDYFDYSYVYFGITKDELTKSTVNYSDSAPTPDCTGTKYNYFVYNGSSFAQYEFEAVKTEMLEQATTQNYIALRFDSYSELLAAESDLITSSRIYEVFPDKEEIRYAIGNSSLHLYIFF